MRDVYEIVSQGEDPFSWRNMALVGLKLFLAIAGGSSGANEKSDNPIEVGIIGVNIFMLLNQLYFLHALNAYILSQIFFDTSYLYFHCSP